MVNYRYFVSGGPERYMFNVMDALRTQGHEVTPFSIRYAWNRPTPYGSYFVDPLGEENELTFREQKLTGKSLWRTFSRLVYASDVERAVRKIIEVSQSEVGFVLHYLRKLSPSVLVGLKKAGLPIVVRLSDYAMLCPQTHCLRGGVPCELCVRGRLWPSVRFRCVQNSLTISALNALATWYHRFRQYFDLVDVFVTTNPFMYKLMMSAGFSEERIRCIPTFVDLPRLGPGPNLAKGSYMAYVGRLEAIKGVHILVDALARLRERRPDLDISLKIAGTGKKDYSDSLVQKIEKNDLRERVEFLGELGLEEVSSLLHQAYLCVVPALIYENLPNVVLESYACGTPVVASNLGSLAECVSHGETGYLFRTGDASDLAKILEHCFEHPQEVAMISRQAKNRAETVYSPGKHVERLESLFTDLLTGK